MTQCTFDEYPLIGCVLPALLSTILLILLNFEQREKNLNLGMKIWEKYNFTSQASKKWRCLASEEMKISDLKVLLNEYQTCEADLNHLAILNTSIQNNLTQFKDSDKILTCIRLSVIKGTERLDEENFYSNPSEYKIKYPTKRNGERIEDYEEESLGYEVLLKN